MIRLVRVQVIKHEMNFPVGLLRHSLVDEIEEFAPTASFVWAVFD